MYLWLFLVQASIPLCPLAGVLWKVVQDLVVVEPWCIFLYQDGAVSGSILTPSASYSQDVKF
jgi:hypothetical protein